MKKIILVLFILSSPLFVLQSVFAAPATSSSKIQIKDQIIYGENGDYMIKVPSTWLQYIVAESEPATNSKFLEKLNFYYKPQSKNDRSVLFMSLYVFKKADWNENSAYKKVTENHSYVFAMTNVLLNPFTKESDRAIFKRLLIETNTPNFVKNMILFPSSESSEMNNRIIVNGKMLTLPVISKENNISYLPLRETCEALGYTVTWSPKNRGIAVTKGDYSIVFSLDSDSANSGYKIILHEGVAYAGSVYFVWSIKANLEVDANNNISVVK